MSALARIRKTALQHEQERQYDKALALYARILDGAEAGEEEVDVALFNRAGDLALRVGDTPRALGYFERALDLYASGGLLNNAVALGVKMLRHAPAHLSAHYTLGVLYGRKGFATEARHHLLTYAMQMQRAGRADEAARVLGEVAAACLDAGERRAALDAYGALGGDLAHAAALAAEPVSARSEPVAPPPVAEAPVTWGAVDFEPTATTATTTVTPASEPWSGPELMEWGDVVLDAPTPESVGSTWDMLDLEPAVPHEVSGEVTAEAPVVADTPSLVFLDIGSDIDPPHVDALDLHMPGVDTVEPVDVAMVDVAAPAAATGPRWPTALPDEPPPLRLAELLRLDVQPDAPFESSACVELDGAVLGSSDLAVEPPAASARWFIGLDADALENGDADDHGIEVVPSYAFRFDTPDLDVPDPSLADALDAALELPMVGTVAPAPAELPVALELAAPMSNAEPGLDDAEVPDEVPATSAADATDDLLDLGAWLRESEEAPTTRMTTASVPQTGDEQADFDATLRVFTAGVARAVEHHDFDGHYDLGVAFREMGLVDEAIVEFQRAALAPGRPLRALEALAQCWVDVRQPEVALSTLEAAVAEAAAAGAGDASLVGVHYLMGAAAQALGRADDARRWFVRVVATDVRFRDAAARLAALPPPSPSP